VQEFAKTYLKAYYQATSAESKLFPDTTVTLSRLAEKARLALITQRCVSKEKIVKQLRKFGIAKHFRVIVTGNDTNYPKPSPEGLMRCSTKLGVRICDCVVVGDSTVDIQAGRNAGAKTVAVLSGIFSFEELQKQKPDLILENVAKLPDFLE
jgi:phosphoglycolate phosphatase